MSRVSLSFLVDTMDKRRGGCAPNIAYTLALLGERPRADGDGRPGLRRLPALARGGGRRHVARQARSPDKFTASFFCSTDSANNQIASFYTGAMAHAAELSFRTRRRRRPGDHLAERSGGDDCSTRRSAGRSGIPFIFDPGQQCARMYGDELADGIDGARPRDLQRLRARADPAEDRARRGRHPRRAPARWSSRAASTGRRCSTATAASTCPRCRRTRIVDPTGVGDAYRGGFMKGLAHGADLEVCARLGSVAATYALEHLGGQSHAYTWARVHGALRGRTSARSRVDERVLTVDPDRRWSASGGGRARRRADAGAAALDRRSWSLPRRLRRRRARRCCRR